MIKNNIKSVINVVIILILIMCMIEISKSSANAATSGKWEYQIVSGSITPSGAEITVYSGSESYVEIPEIIDGYKVIGLGNDIFKNNTALTQVSIPAYVEWIGDSSFAGCTNLITVNNNSTMLNTVGEYAFSNCISLTSFVLPKVSSSTAIYTTIGYRAFYNCQSLATLNVKAVKLTDCSSSGNTFYDAGGAVAGGLKVIFSDDVTNIPAYMFSCDSAHYARVTNVTVGKNVKSIGKSAFTYCADLKTVTNNSTLLDTVGYHAFYNCFGLTSITFNFATTTIYDSASTIPETTKIIGYDPSTAKDYATKYNRAFEVISIVTPTFNPVAGTYTATQNVTISCSTTGATIRYTLDGSDPTTLSPLYSTPVLISATKTLKAKAFKTGMTNSATGSAAYIISFTDPYEPNNTLATAYGPISSGVYYNGYISTSTDQDWFKISTSVVGTISIGLTNLPGDYDIGLYNSNKVLLGFSKKGGKDTELITITSAPVGTYYIGVFGWAGDFTTTQSYTLKATY